MIFFQFHCFNQQLFSQLRMLLFSQLPTLRLSQLDSQLQQDKHMWASGYCFLWDSPMSVQYGLANILYTLYCLLLLTYQMWRAIFTVKSIILTIVNQSQFLVKYIIAIQHGTLLIFFFSQKRKEKEERNHKQSFTLYWVWHLDHLIQYEKLFRRGNSIT